MPPPVALPTYEIKIYWHERYHADPTNRWFRRSIVKLFHP